MDILLIGCGKMGGAMLRQWQKNSANRFTVADPAAAALGDGVIHVPDAASLKGARFDAVIIAVKPQLIAKVAPTYRDALKPGGCFVSIAAGCSIATLESILGAVPVIRVMPNLPAMVGHGVSGIYANDKCSTAQVKAITALVGETGTAIAVASEDEIDRLTAISGSGPGYMFEFTRSFIAAAEGLGFSPDTARKLVLGTMAGAVETARQSGESAASLRESVTSKNGTTEAGLAEFRRDGILDALLQDTVKAAYARAQALQ